MWYHTKNASAQLKSFAKGFDADDNKLTQGELQSKYQGKTLEAKAQYFNSLKIREQQYLLYAALTGKETEDSKKITDTAKHQLVIARILFFGEELEKLGKYEEWVKRSAPFDVFVRLPLKEKGKYHNAMQAFHDKERSKIENKPPSTEPVLDSSPTAHTSLGGGFPDLDDPTKFEKMK